MNCPRCQGSNYIKYGIVNNRQRYRCKSCSYNYTVLERGRARELKKMALLLYLEGFGFKFIERMLGVSNVTVMGWIKRYGRNLEHLRSNKDIDVVKVDNFNNYIASKTIILGYGLLFSDIKSGTASTFFLQGTQKEDLDKKEDESLPELHKIGR